MGIIVYRVYDFYESFKGDLVGEYNTLDDARKACKRYAEDTDGECYLEIFDNDGVPVE